jgi:hypothetical protein
MGIPILRLTLESSRMSIVQAFSEYAAQRDEMLVAAVNDYCTPENLRAVVAENVRSVLDAVIREEVERYYRHGAGRKVVRDEVERLLSLKGG